VGAQRRKLTAIRVCFDLSTEKFILGKIAFTKVKLNLRMGVVVAAVAPLVVWLWVPCTAHCAAAAHSRDIRTHCKLNSMQRSINALKSSYGCE
jgi:hypothetical protein